MSAAVNSALSSAVSTRKTTKTDNSGSTKLTASDFLKLFVTQVQNQDFNSPMDNSAMMSQITQLSNMQMMQEMASYSKTSYAMSLVGKNVIASRYTNGKLDTETGTVSKVSLVDDAYVLYVNGKKYKLEEIMEIKNGSGSDSKLDPTSYPLKITSVTSSSAALDWSIPTEDPVEASGLKYSVYYSKEGPFNTATDVEKGTRFGSANQTGLLNETITGLEAGQAYYINVLVQDTDGNKYVYKPTVVVTNK
jgi:flagellar hook assembly protein FlgD